MRGSGGGAAEVAETPPLVFGGLAGFRARIQVLSGKVVAHQRADCREVGEMAEGAQLAADIAERRGFDRSGEHGETAEVGAELVEESVLAAATDDMDAMIVQSMCNLAKTKSLCVVAEYVETPEQREMLLRFGVDYLQGYLIGKPKPLEELRA